LYELLTGTPPQPELLWSGAFDPAGDGGPGRRLPPALERICRRALQPDPAQRPATALAFAQELERFAAVRTRTVRLLLATSVLLWTGIAATTLNGALGGVNGSDQPASTGVVGELRHRPGLLAAELTDFLQRAVDQQRTPLLVLADGRTLPLRLPRRGGGSSNDSADLVRSLLNELLELPGVNLLFLGREDFPHPAAGDQRHPSLPSVALPLISAETAVRICPESVCVVDGGAAGGIDPRRTARWCAVRVELTDMTPEFDALVFRTSAGTRAAKSGTGTRFINNVGPAPHP
jgi:hypothetical protein